VYKLMVMAALATLTAACVSTPRRSEPLEEARAEVQKLSQDPLAQQAANSDLEAARGNLQQADTALQQRKPPELIDHLAYLALRHAQAGEARVAEAQARQEVARAQQERNRVVLEARERETQQARSEAATAKNTAQAAQSQLTNARQELHDLQVKETQRGMVLTLSDVLFDTGKATLKPGADRALDRLSQFLKDSSGTRVIIEGHTDSRGGDTYNQELSELRAQAVADALGARGVPADRYATKGFGKAYPIASNDTPAGRQQNRRVEIVFSDESGRFASGASEPQRR
jgi:outer membrane protein OmpA-like peptidoglycan-associated protein